jgi:hypothetical protein
MAEFVYEGCCGGRGIQSDGGGYVVREDDDRSRRFLTRAPRQVLARNDTLWLLRHAGFWQTEGAVPTIHCLPKVRSDQNKTKRHQPKGVVFLHALNQPKDRLRTNGWLGRGTEP